MINVIKSGNTVAILLLIRVVITLLLQFTKHIGQQSAGDSPDFPGFNITEIVKCFRYKELGSTELGEMCAVISVNNYFVPEC